MVKIRKVVNSSRDEVVESISKGAARYIAKRAVSESPNIMKSVDVMHDVVRHLMKKIGSERRAGERRKR